ncbi:unnamed protein product [Brassica rapa]|uniref:Uncharacterized protein n=1 Tax=Brassica campestris TaxID=3711 RepID=A0A8D9HVV2_BRACM|nr:unnamed protein product [Brassica rapa]
MLHCQCFPFYLSLREDVCPATSHGLSIKECVSLFPLEFSSRGLWWFMFEPVRLIYYQVFH